MIVFGLVVLAFAGFSLDIDLTLGWGGRPVLDAVNPLWIRLENPGPDLLMGEIWVRMDFGSSWRGTASYTAVVPFSLGAFWRTRLLLPWPLRVGASFLKVSVSVDGSVLAEEEWGFSPEPGPLRAGIGPPRMPLDLFLSPGDLPSDPLLLSPFSELQISTTLSASQLELLRAWELLVRDMKINVEALREHLHLLRPSPPFWGALVPGLFSYALLLSLALSRASRGSYRMIAVVIGVFLCFSLIYTVLRGSAPTQTRLEIQIFPLSLDGFYGDLVGIVSWRVEEGRLPGWWVELLPPRGWEGCDVLWRFDEEGWHTEFRLEPGVPRVFWRIARNARPLGEPIFPPGWLQQSLSLPWKKAEVHRLPTEPGQEAYLVILP